MEVGTKLRGRRVTIMGLGLHGGGVAAARYCAQQEAAVTVTDLADEQTLAESLAQLADVPIARFAFGEHIQRDFQTAEVIVVNPAVRPGNRFVELARQSGVQVTSETELFLNACPATVIGVTGTVGKSTTATMLADMIAASRPPGLARWKHRAQLARRSVQHFARRHRRARTEQLSALLAKRRRTLAAARDRHELFAKSFGLARELGTLHGCKTTFNRGSTCCGHRGSEYR